MNPYRSTPPAPRKSNITIVPWERPRLNVLAVLGWLLTALAALGLLGSLTHCANWQKTALDVLSVIQIACIIENQALGDDDVRKVCEITDEFVPPMKRVLVESRAATKRAREEAGSCK